MSNHYTYQFARRAASRGARRRRRSRFDTQMHEQGVSERNPVAPSRSRAEDADGAPRQRRPDSSGARLALHPEGTGQRVLPRRHEDRVGRGTAALPGKALRQIGPGHRAGMAADRVRLARRRLRPAAALRLQVLHGEGALAGGEARIRTQARGIDGRVVGRRSAGDRRADGAFAPRT